MELLLPGSLFYSLLAFIPALFNIGIIFFILFKLPKSKTTDLFTCIVIALVLWQLEDSILRLSPNLEITRFWDSILSIGWLGIAPLTFHFSCRYSSLKKFTTRTALFLVYFPFILFYVIYVANLESAVYFRDDIWGWINKPRQGSLEEFQRYWISIMILLAVFILIRHAARIKKSRNQKKQAWIIAIGILIPAVQGIVTQVIFPLFLEIKEIPITSTFMTVFSFATIIALSKYKLFHLSDSVESHNLLENLNRFVLIISLDKKIIYINRYASQVLGIKQDETEMSSFEKIFPPLDEEYGKYLEDVFEKVINGKPVDNYSSTFFTSEHKKVNVMMTSSLVINNKIKQGVLLLANDITKMVTALKDLELERLRKEKEIAEAVIHAQENERKMIGGELHDNVNQVLASSLLYLSIAKRDSENEIPYFGEINSLINDAILEIRQLSHTLIAPSLKESELSLALDNIISAAGKTGTLIIEKEVSGINENIIPEKLKLNIYRIVQEQFNNIIKYAMAKTVYLKLVQQEDKLLLKIKDDGIGFDTSKKSGGRGILNMKSRAVSNNGEMKIISSPGNGCELYVTFENFAF